MSKVPPKKFQYQKDYFDWIYIWIIVFTLVCFGVIFYGISYFGERQVPTSITGEGNIQELVEDREKLQQQISEYLQETTI